MSESMIQITPIEELRSGDIVLIDDEGELSIVTVGEVDLDEGTFSCAEMDNMDYYPDDLNAIIKIGFMSKANGNRLFINSYWVDCIVKKKPEIG